MKRAVLKAMLFLLLGALANVAVAWGLAAWIDVAKDPGLVSLSEAEPPSWYFHRYKQIGAVRLVSDIHEGWATINDQRPVLRRHLVPQWSRIVTRPTYEETLERFSWSVGEGGWTTYMIEDARGWPLCSLRMAWNLGAFDGNETRSNGIALQSVFSHTMLPESLRGLPTTPIWPGFAINTLLYAATLYLLFTTPAKLRRHRRIKR
ncbi:MAG: hypothetical protein L0Y42_01095, partial [Phycisphaerales bacterium]|nr:hypothetical protein [Phycisphaerales bacterium]